MWNNTWWTCQERSPSLEIMLAQHQVYFSSTKTKMMGKTRTFCLNNLILTKYIHLMRRETPQIWPHSVIMQRQIRMPISLPSLTTTTKILTCRRKISPAKRKIFMRLLIHISRIMLSSITTTPTIIVRTPIHYWEIQIIWLTIEISYRLMLFPQSLLSNQKSSRRKWKKYRPLFPMTKYVLRIQTDKHYSIQMKSLVIWLQPR